MSIGFDVFDKTDANPWLFLQHRARSSFSQFGEDGIIASIFEKIGTTSRWCFEVGANDGVWFSNTKELRDAGWSAVLMESDAAAFAQLLPHRAEGTYCVSVRIGPPPNSIDEVLKACDVPREMDFGSIDIDSDDYWVWADMTETLHGSCAWKSIHITWVRLASGGPVRKQDRRRYASWAKAKVTSRSDGRIAT